MKLFFQKLNVVCVVLSFSLHLLPSNTGSGAPSEAPPLSESVSLRDDLAYIKKIADEHHCAQQNLLAVCEQITQGITTIPINLISAALEEAITCLTQCKDTLSTDDVERLANNFEQYHEHLMHTDAAEISLKQISGETFDNVSEQKRGTTIKKVTNLIVHNTLEAGNMFIAGDVLIDGNETVEGTLKVHNLIITDNTTIGSCPSTTNINGNVNINTSGCADPTNIGSATSATNIHGPTTIASTVGIPLQVMGNAANPTVQITGSGTLVAPALQLFGNPAAFAGNQVLQIDAGTGTVTQGSAAGSGFIVNNCQPGPLTIGTTNGTSLSLNTGSAGVCNQRILIDANGGITIQTPAGGETGLTIVGGGASVTGTTTINTSGAATTTIGTGGGATSIGSSASNNTIQGTTNDIGNTFMSAPSGVVLTVTGSSANTAVIITGGGAAGALRLIGNQPSVATDLVLSIDPVTGIVRQGPGTATGEIVNGCQAGPLTIGTTNGTSLSLNTGMAGVCNQRILIDANGGITIQTPAGGETGLTIVGGGANVTGTTTINTTGSGSTTIGNCPNTTTTISGTTNINTSGTCTTNIGTAGGATNIGSSASTNTIQGTNDIIGNTFMSAPTGVVLTVTGNATNPSTVLVGNSTTTAPALKLINNPAGSNTDFLLTIDSTGVVRQTPSSIQTGFIVNGCQPGPLTIGTTNGTSLSLNTGSAGVCNQRLTIDANGGVTIQTPAGNEPGLTIMTSGNQNAITTSNGTVSAPAYSFISSNTNTGMYSPATNQLALVTSATGRLVIDGTGSVSYFSKYRAHAYLNAGQVINVSPTTIVFNSVASPGFDSNNNFNTATGTYTAPISGYYLVSVCVGYITMDATPNDRSINFAKNGIAFATGYNQTINTNSANVEFFLSETEIIQLNGGDALTVQFTTGSPGNDTLQDSRTHINIHFFSTV